MISSILLLFLWKVAYQKSSCYTSENNRDVLIRHKMENGHLTAPTQPKVGFITMAYGRQKYIDQAVALARSVKLHMPDQPIALVTDRQETIAPFDSQIVMDDYGLAGTVLKILIYKYSPFEETLFIDSDCLLTRDCTPEVAQIRTRNFSPVVNTYLRAGDHDLWLEDVGKAVQAVGGDTFPKFNGGVYFFRKSPESEAVFAVADEVRTRQRELGIIDFDAAGPGEETLFGLALAKLGIDDLYDDGGRLMRTPLNSTGPIRLDIFRSECRFVKEGKLVEPAIVHFCGEWIDHPSYRIAVKELTLGKRLSNAERKAIEVLNLGQRVRRKILRRFA